jgi:uncharacterized protein with HEPN domain
VKDDQLYLVHILDCILRIERYTADGRDAFFRDTKTQDAVLRNLQTLAESVQRLSQRLKASRAETDWRSIAAFRNVAVHGYLGIDLTQIWEIVERDLAGLKRSIEAILKGREPEGLS